MTVYVNMGINYIKDWSKWKSEMTLFKGIFKVSVTIESWEVGASSHGEFSGQET